MLCGFLVRILPNVSSTRCKTSFSAQYLTHTAVSRTVSYRNRQHIDHDHVVMFHQSGRMWAVPVRLTQSSTRAPSTPSSSINLSKASLVQWTQFQPPASPCFLTLVPRSTSNNRSISTTFARTNRTRIESTAVNQIFRSSYWNVIMAVSLPFMLSSKVIMVLAWHLIPCEDLFSFLGPMRRAQ